MNVHVLRAGNCKDRLVPIDPFLRELLGEMGVAVYPLAIASGSLHFITLQLLQVGRVFL